jgi:hypothetical protein
LDLWECERKSQLLGSSWHRALAGEERIGKLTERNPQRE